MKARDIIPGWPRGRSTTSLYSPELPFFLFPYDRSARMKCIVDFRANAEYHESQRRMIWSIWEQYRRFELMRKYPRITSADMHLDMDFKELT